MNSRIAFTSCCRFEAFNHQPQWDEISNTNPDYLFLLGDQIYMDYGIRLFSKEWNGRPKKYSESEFEAIMESKYYNQWNEPHFKALFDRLNANNKVHGIWDDHDFAWNNAVGSDVSAEKKEISLKIFKKYFCLNDTNSTPGEIYRTIDTPLAKVIFLDVRSHAVHYQLPNSPSDSALLGQKQRDFLKANLLASHDKPYTIICSGITLRFGEENWSNYEQDFNQLISYIKQSQKPVIFLAGDIHENKFVGPSEECPCYEIVSSGLAINYLGLGIDFDDRHNWGLLTLNDQGGSNVQLFSKKSSKTFDIE